MEFLSDEPLHQKQINKKIQIIIKIIINKKFTIQSPNKYFDLFCNKKMLFSVMNISACNEIIQKSQTFTKIITDLSEKM